MTYTLITAAGKIMQFYIQDVAFMYANLYGGTVITEEILVDSPAQIAV